MTDRKSKDIQGRKIANVHTAITHDSAYAHVSGTALYVDDIPEPSRLLHCYVGTSDVAHARVLSMDLTEVERFPGVIMTLTAADLPGSNDISPVHQSDEPVLVDDLVQYAGQPLFAVLAQSRTIARQAARLAKIEYQELPAILDIETALARQSYVLDPHVLTRGDTRSALREAPERLQGKIYTGGQEHFYLEGQVSMALPGEDGDMLVLTSSQNPSEVQQLVAHSLNKPINAITVEVRRMGGAFGGKETQAAQWAIIAAVMADTSGHPVKLRLDRDDDMRSTGKRHDFQISYDVGFDPAGHILGVEFIHAIRCGM